MQTEPKRPAAVTKAPDGTWQVTAPDGSVLAACATNAEAWKSYDKLAAEPLSPSYAGGASILFVLLIAALGVWYWLSGSVSVDTITSPKVEMFYWGTILFSQTLGTALGDWMADTTGLGYEGGALVFAA
jgi:uncharacterized membrane-anchored protein